MTNVYIQKLIRSEINPGNLYAAGEIENHYETSADDYDLSFYIDASKDKNNDGYKVIVRLEDKTEYHYMITCGHKSLQQIKH